MATMCPYCNIEVSESAIEAEDGCCPECGSVITVGSMIADDDEEEHDGFDDERDDTYDGIDDEEDEDRYAGDNDDLSIFDEDFGGEFEDEEFKDEEFEEEDLR